MNPLNLANVEADIAAEATACSQRYELQCNALTPSSFAKFYSGRAGRAMMFHNRKIETIKKNVRHEQKAKTHSDQIQTQPMMASSPSFCDQGSFTFKSFKLCCKALNTSSEASQRIARSCGRMKRVAKAGEPR